MLKRDLHAIGHLNTMDFQTVQDRLSRPNAIAGSCLQRNATKVLHIPGFDLVMGLIIAFNMVVIIIEANRSASEEEDSNGTIHWTDVFSWVVLTIFVLELLLRLLAFQCAFWRDAWNVGDFMIVTVDLVCTVIGLVAGDIFPVSMLRVFRLSKLARISKVLRIFPELKMLIIGLVHSLRAIFWGTVLLFFLMLVWSVMAVLLIHPLNKNIDYGDSCERCPRAYSSVWQSALTFWQQIVAGDSWGQATIPIIEKHPGTLIFFTPVFMSIALCVLNLLLATIVNFAQQGYDNQVEKEETEHILSTVEDRNNIFLLCKELDTDDNGELSFAEICAGFKKEGVLRDAMTSAGFTDDVLDMAWAIMDIDESGSASYKEFVTFLFEMKQSHPHFMLCYIKYHITWMKNNIEKQMEAQGDRLLAESKRVGMELQKATEKLEEEQAAIHEEEQIIFSNLQQEHTSNDREHQDHIGNQLWQHTVLDDRQVEGRFMPTRDSLDVAGINAGEGVMPVNLRTAKQDPMKQMGDEAGSKPLELKDILTDINCAMCESTSVYSNGILSL